MFSIKENYRKRVDSKKTRNQPIGKATSEPIFTQAFWRQINGTALSEKLLV